MKRGEFSSIMVLLTALVFVVFWNRYCNVDQKPLQEEVAKIVAGKYVSHRNVAEISPQLASAINADPNYVVVCLVVAEARYWPGITRVDEERILLLAGKDTKAALDELQRRLYNSVTRRMLEGGYNPAKECRRSWNKNNIATAILFQELPVAQRLGRVRQFLTQELEGYRPGRVEWYKPEISFEQYARWGYGEWPFPGEKPPVYQPDEGLEEAKRQNLAPPIIILPLETEKNQPPKKKPHPGVWT